MSVKQIFNTSAELDYPTVLPTLDLDFANSKTLDPRITFTRSSGGSYVGADGLIKLAGVNEARFDHDPVTGESLGLLIEESRTNLLARSEEFVGFWSLEKTEGSPLDMSTTTILSPDGRSFFTLGTYGRNDIRRSFPGGSGKTYTASCFYKQPDNNTAPDAKFEVHIIGGTTTNSRITYNFSSNSITRLASNSSSFTGGFERYSNGVVRVYLTFTDDGDGTNVFFLNLRDDATQRLMDGKQILFWGAQIEEGSFPTSYIPTEGSTRTRAADNASITGKNFSEWYRPDEGTIYCAFKLNSNAIARVFNIDDGTSTNRISGLVQSSLYQTFITPAAVGPTASFSNIFDFKIASGHQDNNIQVYVNSIYQNSNTSITIPKNLNTFRIGNWQNGTLQGTTIARLTYYPKRLPNSQLITLTS